MKFRIIALPLATTTKSISRATTSIPGKSHTLVYYHFQEFPAMAKEPKPASMLKRVLGRATTAWAKMGAAPEGNWKRNIFIFGERLMDRIDFEETALKGLHPPSERPESIAATSKTVEQFKVKLLHPGALENTLENFSELVRVRMPFHRKGMWTWLFIAPFTAPFALIPIIPNLPFFFAAWRSWSHWRAWKSATYLDRLIQEQAFELEESSYLDEIYSPDKGSTNGVEEGEKVLLAPEMVPRIVANLELKAGASTEILKALDQTRLRMRRAQES